MGSGPGTRGGSGGGRGGLRRGGSATLDSGQDPNPNPIEQEFLEDYQGPAFKFVNEGLRNDALSKQGALMVPYLDSLISRNVLSEDQNLFRWTKSSLLKDVQVGSVMRDKAYLSTSRSATVTSHLGDVVIKIRAPKGTKGVDVNKYSQHTRYSWEQEILLPRNVGLKVTKIWREGSIKVFEVDIVD
jgi:hypothetical protein